MNDRQSQIAIASGQDGHAPGSSLVTRHSSLRPLYAEWGRYRKAHPAPEGLDERGWRIQWTNDAMVRRHQKLIESWNDLTPGQVKMLIRALRAAGAAGVGEAERRSALRLRYVMYLAPRVYGPEWDALLHGRLERSPYLYYDSVERLDPRRMHGLIEELLDVLARMRAEAGKSKMENGKSGNSKLETGNCTADFPISNFQFPLSSEELRAAKAEIRAEMVAAVRGGRASQKAKGKRQIAKGVQEEGYA
jgi:hypothetical protein